MTNKLKHEIPKDLLAHFPDMKTKFKYKLQTQLLIAFHAGRESGMALMDQVWKDAAQKAIDERKSNG